MREKERGKKKTEGTRKRVRKTGGGGEGVDLPVRGFRKKKPHVA